MREPPAEANLSISELLQRLASETSLLVRQEVELARAEFGCAAKAAARPAAAFGIAGLFALGMFGALTALLIVAIAAALPLWAAALIVTLLYGAIAGGAVALGRTAMRDVSVVPPLTIKTIKEDVRAVRSGIERSR